MTQETVVGVSIIPGTGALANEEEKERLLKFRRTLKEIDFDGVEFARILDDVCSTRSFIVRH